MDLVRLGASDLRVSRLTLGCWSFGGDAQSYWGAQAQSVVDAVVAEALDQGVNFFDTAFIYNDGQSEESLGKALAGKRQRAVICNKIPVQPFEALPSYEKAVQDSLRRLGTDAVDVLMLHWPTKDEALLRANLEALDGVRRKGMARAVGVSNFGVRTLEIAREMGLDIAVNEFAYNLVSRGMEGAILPYCRAQNIAVAAYMPLMQGLLSGRYKRAADMPPLRTRTIHFDNANNPDARHGGPGAEAEVFACIDRLTALAAENGISPAQLALAWLLSKPGLQTAIVGCRNVAQLRENIAGAAFAPPQAVLDALDAASAPILAKLGDNCDLWQLDGQSRIW